MNSTAYTPPYPPHTRVEATRLLPHRGRGRPPLLGVPRGPLRRQRDRFACLVSARSVRVMARTPRYAELDVTTNFSFLRGGSHAEELVATAKALGLAAIAVTDRNTLAGVVRAHLAAREVGGIKFIVGAASISTMRRASSSTLRTAQLTAGFAGCSRSASAAPRRGNARSISTMSPPTPTASSSSRCRPTFASQLRRIKQALGPARGSISPPVTLSRRRSRPHRRACAIGGARGPSPRRHRRRALSRSPPPALAGRAHLHPREMHDP